MVIDDDQDLLHALRVRMKSSGFNVHFASDAVLAVHLASRVKPDLIILDIGLPGGDGYLTMERLRSKTSLAHVPIIIITAGDASVHREKALQAGAEAFFPNPSITISFWRGRQSLAVLLISVSAASCWSFAD